MFSWSLKVARTILCTREWMGTRNNLNYNVWEGSPSCWWRLRESLTRIVSEEDWLQWKECWKITTSAPSSDSEWYVVFIFNIIWRLSWLRKQHRRYRMRWAIFVSMHPEHLLLDVPCNFCVFIDFVDGNKGEDVFCGQYLLLQGVIETYPSIHQECTPHQTDRQHSSKQQAIIL